MQTTRAVGLGIAAALLVGSWTSVAGATNYSLWIHGRNTGGTPSGWNYWVDSKGHNVAQGVGVNAIAVDYDGSQHISQSNTTVVNALNTYCQGGNSCYVQCHSAGCNQIGYAVAYNPSRWHIVWVWTGGSAAGGSELANAGSWMTGYAIDGDLQVSTSRGMYNHDVLGDSIAGYVYNLIGGDYANLTTCFFPGGCAGGSGGNDSAVAFHTAGHYRSSGAYGTAAANGAAGGTYWDYSWSWFVDGIHSNDGKYGHAMSGSYPVQEGVTGGIMAVVSGNAAYNDH